MCSTESKNWQESAHQFHTTYRPHYNCHFSSLQRVHNWRHSDLIPSPPRPHSFSFLAPTVIFIFPSFSLLSASLLLPSFSPNKTSPLQWYQSQADLVWPDGTFEQNYNRIKNTTSQQHICYMKQVQIRLPTGTDTHSLISGSPLLSLILHAHILLFSTEHCSTGG
jgi:hypothetical protein